MGNYRRWEGAAPGGRSSTAPPPPPPDLSPPVSTAQRGAAPPHRVPIGVCVGGVPSSAPSACIGPAPNRITESLFTGLLFFLCAWWLLAPSPANLPPRRRSGQSHPPPPTASASYLPQLLWGRGGCRGASASRRVARGRGGGVKGCWGRAPPPPGKSRRGRQHDRRFISRAGGWAHRAAGPLLPPGRSEDIKKMAPNRIDTPLTHTP